MKCYRHPQVDAVGICSECGKGVCSACAVTVDGKLYCKPDTNKLFAKQRSSNNETPKQGHSFVASITSFVFILYGAAELGLSFLLLYAGTTSDSFDSLTQVLPNQYTVNLIDASVSLLPLILGMVLLFVSIAGIGAGIEIWRGRKGGGVLGLAQIIMAILITLLFLSPAGEPSYAAYFYALIVFNVLLGCLTIAIWTRLR